MIEKRLRHPEERRILCDSIVIHTTKRKILHFVQDDAKLKSIARGMVSTIPYGFSMPPDSSRGYTPEARQQPPVEQTADIVVAEPTEKKSKKTLLTMTSNTGETMELYNFEYHVMDALREPGMSDSDLALKIIEKGKAQELSKHLEYFSQLNFAVADKLIKTDADTEVIARIDRFNPTEHKAIALRLIQEGNIHYSAFEKRFQNMDLDVLIAAARTQDNREQTIHLTTNLFNTFHTEPNEAIARLAEIRMQFSFGDVTGLNAESAMLIATKNPFAVLKRARAFSVTQEELDEAVAKGLNRGYAWNKLDQLLKDFQGDELPNTFPKTHETVYAYGRKKLDEGKFSRFTDRVDLFESLTQINQAAFTENPWSAQPCIEQLLKLQKRSENTEYDPWKTDLDPLVKFLEGKGYVDLSTGRDAQLLVEFVKRFGMSNTPVIASAFFEIHQDGILFSREALSEFLGKDVKEFSKDKTLLNELEQKQRWLLKQLLADVVPQGVDTRIGLEVLDLIKGTSSWDRDDKPADLLAAWKRTIKEKPELAKLPEGYVEYEITVPVVDRRPQNAKEQTEIETKRAEILALKTVNKEGKEVPTELGAFVEKFYGATQEKRILEESFEEEDKSDWWKTKRAELVESIFPDFDIQQKLEEQKLLMEKRGLPAAFILKSLETTQAALQAKKNKATELALTLAQIESVAKVATTETTEYSDTFYPMMGILSDFMESVAKVLPKGPQTDQFFLALSLEHMKSLPDTTWNDAQLFVESFIKNAHHDNQPSLSKSTFDKTAAFFLEYVSEHYLQKGQVEIHTGHPAFSPELLKALESAWGASGADPKKDHVIVKTKNKIAALESTELVKSEKTKKISLVPAKGILRIFSGDTGDTCITRQHNELANGEFPGITAYSFVVNKGTVNERVQGSVLFIETTSQEIITDDFGNKKTVEKNVLIVRANNPRENLIQDVDADKLITETLNVAVDLAFQRGLDEVVVPRDNAREASSNREKVSAYYKRVFKTAPVVSLKDEPETNFNGNNVWDPKEHHAVVSIWKRAKDE